jgi:hypothetical protein
MKPTVFTFSCLLAGSQLDLLAGKKAGGMSREASSVSAASIKRPSEPETFKVRSKKTSVKNLMGFWTEVKGSKFDWKNNCYSLYSCAQLI